MVQVSLPSQEGSFPFRKASFEWILSGKGNQQCFGIFLSYRGRLRKSTHRAIHHEDERGRPILDTNYDRIKLLLEILDGFYAMAAQSTQNSFMMWLIIDIVSRYHQLISL